MDSLFFLAENLFYTTKRTLSGKAEHKNTVIFTATRKLTWSVIINNVASNLQVKAILPFSPEFQGGQTVQYDRALWPPAGATQSYLQ
jgi:hypothetical protein